MIDEPALIGHILEGKYRIEKWLAQGGMGAVYLAIHVGTGRPVALKVIFPYFLDKEEFVERFRREARALGLLRHPNIVDVTDFGFCQFADVRLGYLVMEYLDGVSLSDVLKEEKKLKDRWVVDILEQICLGIDRAHTRGIVHRDLKPDNIWLEPNDRGGYTVKVLDFGIAHLILSQPSTGDDDRTTLELTGPDSPSPGNRLPRDLALAGDNGSSRPLDLTEPGKVLGTPHYMSPEQCLGRPVDETSDVYSIGVMAYQMLAGELPFDGDRALVVAQQVETNPVSLGEKRPDLPKRAVSVVMAALSKEPFKRPRSAVAFATAFRARMEGGSFLIRHALNLYGDHFPTFIRISLAACVPLMFLPVLFLLNLIPGYQGSKIAYVFLAVTSLIWLLGYMGAQILSMAVFVPVVAQLLKERERDVRLEAAFKAVKKRLPVFLAASFRFTFLAFSVEFCALTGLIAALILLQGPPPGYDLQLTPAKLVLMALVGVLSLFGFLTGLPKVVNGCLYSAVIVMEGLSGKALWARSRDLVRRSPRAVIKVFLFCALPFMTPGLVRYLWELHRMSGAYWKGGIPVLTTTPIALLFLLYVTVYVFYILIIPILAVTMALLYFKLRRMNGTPIQTVLEPYEREFMRISEWRSRAQGGLTFR